MRKILTIDGGGIKGVFPASFLTTVEETLKVSIPDYFDLIVGTSTGGIIALALGLGFSTGEILEFYEKQGPLIFKRNALIAPLRHLFIGKYSDRPLRKALEETFGMRRLGDSKNRLVIPSANLDTGEAYVYKTRHHESFQRDHLVAAIDVALATAAAPTYFPAHLSSKGSPLVDGGVWANNPLSVAVTEAIGVLGWPAEDIKVLSIGCTAEPFDAGKKARIIQGMVPWAFRLVDLFMAMQSSAALGAAQLLIGHENVFRICPLVPASRYGLDSIQSVSSLKGLGDTEARKFLPQLSVFFQDKAEPFVPIGPKQPTSTST